jgi:signal transduction histidine kinase
MGLGLAIARSIVGAHGGTISARGHDDGAELGLTLPFATHEGASVGEGGAADATATTRHS